MLYHPRSPVPAGDPDGFDGLNYYPPDPGYRFELPLETHGQREQVTVETTREGSQTYRRWGVFRFEIDGEQVVLRAHRADPDEVRLWVPFRDATNGEETYPSGRYLDLEAEERGADGNWVLGFNRAYTPFCAYSDAYECPLVPTENCLDVRIEAGENVLEI